MESITKYHSLTSEKGKEAYKYDKIYSLKGVLNSSGNTRSWDETDDSYRKLWEQYGHGFLGEFYSKEIIDLKPKSVIDIGCGWNEFCQHMKDSGISNCVGVDCSCPGADIIASAHDLSLIDDKAYDLLVSFDCMEHIPEEEVALCFKEFARVSDRMFVQVCLSTHASSIDDEPLHTCIKPSEWWLDQAEAYFKITTSKKTYPRVSAHWQVGHKSDYEYAGHIVIYGESKE